ncbi:hypothetical protein [Phaffia rhodozyma]|uniref:Uncharacterized protein n=1 Tax=Phaffia rhodozyma TaxID=264483 RepID=A0A0F7SVG7_PHARH|nr:hypothetical protein [Phaffia rhodozyma]
MSSVKGGWKPQGFHSSIFWCSTITTSSTHLPPRNVSTSTPHWHKLDPDPLPATFSNAPPLPPRRPTRNPKRKIPPPPELAITQPAIPPALPPRTDGSIAQPTSSSEQGTVDAIETQGILIDSEQGTDDIVGELPSYDHLREQAERSQGSGDSQRFGRWKGWIEKRAGERHLDEQHALEDQLAENRRRSNLGWGAGNYLPRSGSDPLLPAEIEAGFFSPPSAPSSDPQVHESSSQHSSSADVLKNQPSVQSITTTATVGHVASSSSFEAAQTSSLAPVPLTPSQAVYKPLGQSRFLSQLPSSASAPQCLFPLGATSSSLLLIGTKEGLWVFDPVREEPARCVFCGVGVRQMKALGRDQVIMLCHSPAGDAKGEVRVWDWDHLTDMAMWISGSIDSPTPFDFPLGSTSSTLSSSFKSSIPSSSSSATSSLSLSVPQPLRTLAGALHTQHANVPLLNIHHSISGSIKRRIQSSHRNHDDKVSEFTVQSDDVPEFPPRSESVSPYPGRAGLETNGTSSQGGSETGSDQQAKPFQLLSLPAGMFDPGLIEVWVDNDGTTERQSLVAISGKGTACVYKRTDELELAFFREFYLPPQPKPLSALSFVTYISASPASLSSPSSAESSISSLAILFNFSGGKTYLIDLDSAHLIELDWPTSSASPSPPKTITTSNGSTNATSTAQTSHGRAQRETLADEREAARERWSVKGKNRARGRSFGASTEGPTEMSSTSPSVVVDSTSGGGSVKAFVGSVLGSVGISTTSGAGSGGGSKWIGGVEQVWFNRDSEMRGLCLMTRGKETCVWPTPLSIPLPPAAYTFTWPHIPSSISSYLSFSPSEDDSSTEILTVGAIYSSFLGHQVTIDCQSIDVDFNLIFASHRHPSPTSFSPTDRTEVVRRATKDLGQQAGLFDSPYPICSQIQPETPVRWGWDHRGSDDWRFFELRTDVRRN